MRENQWHISFHEQDFPDRCTLAMPQHIGFFRQRRHAPLQEPAYPKVVSDAADMCRQRAVGSKPGGQAAIRR